MTLLEKFKGTLTAQNVFLDENTGGKGKYFKARFLQPGLVKYSFGVCVLEKDTIDKFINGFVGCPVIIGHKDVTSENAKELSCGNICHIWYDDFDGWYWGDGIIDNDEALELINQGYNVSCQYEITEFANNTTNALHNGNPYDKVILNGKPEHLAIVDRPRYENAMIAVNALDLTAENEDKWITIKPNGEDAKGKHLLLKDGETVHEALQRTYGIDGAKGQQKLFDTSGDRKTKEDFRRERDEKQKKYDELEKQQKEARTKEATEKQEKKNKLIQDYIDRKISPEELEKALPDLSFNEWHDIAEKRMNTSEQKQFDKDLKKYKDNQYNWQMMRENPDEYKKIRENYLKSFEEEVLKPHRKERNVKFPNINFNKVNTGTFYKGKTWGELFERRLDPMESKDWEIKEIKEPTDSLLSDEEKLVGYKIVGYDGSKKLTQKIPDTYTNYITETFFKDKSEQDKAQNSVTNTIKQAINEIKETDMFKKLFNRKEQQMEKDEMKSLFIECLQECLQAKNEEDKEDDKKDEKEEEKDLKEKEAENKCKNEVVDKRDIIRQIMAIAGKEEASEDVKTIAKLAEKLAYEKSEADDKADNEEDEKKKEEAKNKAKNSIEEMKAMFSQTEVKKAASNYITRDDAIALGNELF